MMVFGPAGITMTTYSDSKCQGVPAATNQYLSFACFNTPDGGSEMVGLHHHHRYNATGCQGAETKTEVSMYNADGTTNPQCIKLTVGDIGGSVKYQVGPPGYF
jgi:hypothetical protein